MKPVCCPRESETVRAARAGAAPHELQDHLLRCVPCGEVFSVVSSLRTFAVAASAEPLALAPGRIWWKAEIAKERAAAREAMTAVRAVEIAGPVAATCVLGGWIAWHWSEIGSALTNWSGGVSLSGTASLASALVTFAAAAVTLAVAALALRPFLLRDEN